MKNELPKKWLDNLKTLDIAFQPILNMHTGKIFAVEALLRNFQDVGFKSIFALFDKVYKENLLYSFDIALREKALIKFSKIKDFENIKLFYNLDNRLFEMPNFSHGNTNKILKKLGIKKENLCFEISERHEISSESNLEDILKHYQEENFPIAIDDFGVGYSGYKLLYDSTPDIIKIDRYFLQNIETNMKKKLLVRNITHLAIQLGIKVVAEGVETKEELLTCKNIGCHLVQGYLIQHPTKDTTEILKEYPHIIDFITKDRRNKEILNSKMESYLQKIQPLYVKTKMTKVVEYFKEQKDLTLVPVVNSNDEPLGILQESKIKDFLYSPYGISLLHNENSNSSKLKNIINYCSSTDIHTSMENIIEIFSNNPESIGIIITQSSKYYGFLSARAIISIMNEENLILARDQNPLTKLPGNRVIEKYIHDSVFDNTPYLLCYFDLDNFKAFNDVYGFRNGDRVIQFFADILKKHLPHNYFKGHIGGDDFFVAIKSPDPECDLVLDIKNIIELFVTNVKDFYSKEDRSNDFIIAKSREGVEKKFNLLSVSAAVVLMHDNTKIKNIQTINDIFSIQKKVAKADPSHISVSCLL